MSGCEMCEFGYLWKVKGRSGSKTPRDLLLTLSTSECLAALPLNACSVPSIHNTVPTF